MPQSVRPRNVRTSEGPGGGVLFNRLTGSLPGPYKTRTSKSTYRFKSWNLNAGPVVSPFVNRSNWSGLPVAGLSLPVYRNTRPRLVPSLRLRRSRTVLLPAVVVPWVIRAKVHPRQRQSRPKTTWLIPGVPSPWINRAKLRPSRPGRRGSTAWRWLEVPAGGGAVLLHRWGWWRNNGRRWA